MDDIVIELEKGHGLEQHAAELDALLRAAHQPYIVGVTVEAERVTVYVDDPFGRVDDDHLADRVRNFSPQTKIAPTLSQQDALAKIAYLQRQLDELRAAIGKSK